MTLIIICYYNLLFLSRKECRWLFTEPLVLHGGVVVEGFELLRGGKPFEETAAAIAVDDGGNPFVQNPIDEGCDRESEAVRPWDKHDTHDKNEAAEGLVKLFGEIELTALTDRTTIKKGVEGIDLSSLTRAMGANKITGASLHFKRLFTLVAPKTDGLSQRATPNFTK